MKIKSSTNLIWLTVLCIALSVISYHLLCSLIARGKLKYVAIIPYAIGHMFLPPVVSTPQVPRKMGSPMHEESVFYKYNIQSSNLLEATAAFWTFSQKFMKKAKKIHF